MMTDFDDIIRQKSWQELSEAQKADLGYLAADEHTYNTARQILLSAASENEAIPAFTGNMQVFKKYFPGEKRSALRPFLPYAAAIALLLAAGLWWYSSKPVRKPETVGTNKPVNITAPELQPETEVPAGYSDTVAKPGLQTTIRSNQSRMETKSIAVTNVEPRQEQKTQPVFLVSSDPQLLDMITEIY